jgi:hypothetical protein
MQLACPSCGTRDARTSHAQGLVEFLKGLVGVSNLRCRRCNHRWQTSVWANGSWKYARCPRCYRQELTKWAAHYYSPPRWTRILLGLGASPLRCPACRCNFASFKLQRGNFAWRHQIRVEAGALTPNDLNAGQDAAMMAGQTPPGEESEEQMP